MVYAIRQTEKAPHTIDPDKGKPFSKQRRKAAHKKAKEEAKNAPIEQLQEQARIKAEDGVDSGVTISAIGAEVKPEEGVEIKREEVDDSDATVSEVGEEVLYPNNTGWKRLTDIRTSSLKTVFQNSLHCPRHSDKGLGRNERASGRLQRGRNVRSSSPEERISSTSLLQDGYRRELLGTCMS